MIQYTVIRSNIRDMLLVKSFNSQKMIDYETKEEIDVARLPLQKLLIYMPVRVKKHDMMRKV